MDRNVLLVYLHVHRTPFDGTPARRAEHILVYNMGLV
jgi:hypothetical protein